MFKPIACVIYPHKARGKKTLQIAKGITANGTKIVVSDELERSNPFFSNQVFLFNGVTFRSAKNPNKCIQTPGSTKNGTDIQLNDFLKGNINQQWMRQGPYIVSRKNTTQCWTLENGHTHNNTKIHLWVKSKNVNGKMRIRRIKWKGPGIKPGRGPQVQPRRRFKRLGEPCFVVPLKAPGKTLHLDMGHTHNGTRLQLWDRLPRGHKSFENQLWLFNGRCFRSGKNQQKCIRTAGGKTGNGTKIVLGDYNRNGDIGQWWRLVGTNIVSMKNRSACWHLDGGHTGNGTKVQLWNKKNHVNGRWRIVRLRKPKL